MKIHIRDYSPGMGLSWLLTALIELRNNAFSLAGLVFLFTENISWVHMDIYHPDLVSMTELFIVNFFNFVSALSFSHT